MEAASVVILNEMSRIKIPGRTPIPVTVAFRRATVATASLILRVSYNQFGIRDCNFVGD